MSSNIPVGISACLMGEKVRLEAGRKCLAFAMDDLAPFVAFIAICPEMDIDLPAPRPALRLVKIPTTISSCAPAKRRVLRITPLAWRHSRANWSSARRSMRLHYLSQIAELRYGTGVKIGVGL